jgi:HAD superfamily hydrolase (TIGR01549 family)
MPAVQAVFFDLDDTLLDDDRCWRVAVSLACTELALRHPSVDRAMLETSYLENSPRLWATFGSAPRAASGSSAARELRLAVWQTVLDGCSVEAPDIAVEAVDTYERRRRETYACFADVRPVIQRLRERLNLAVITNGPSEGQREKLDITGLTPFLDLVVVSSDLGVGKPDAAIFRYALDHLGLDPACVWHVGDSLFNDVGGARNAGLGSVWLNRRRLSPAGDAPTPDHEIVTLTELVELLRRENGEAGSTPPVC